MELESDDGSKTISIEKSSKIELGRGLLGSPSSDRTVSRRHISLQLHEAAQKSPNENYYPYGEIAVSFEVIGKNPIWVLSSDGGEKRAFRNSEKGDLRAGDRFSISLMKPVFFTLKKRDFEAEKEDDDDDEKRVLKAVKRRKNRTLERKEEEQKRVLQDECSLGDDTEEDGIGDLGFGSLALSLLDPVKEFGFLVMDQEFNQYPKQKIRHIKDWDWFLEEPREDSEDDQANENETRKGKKGEKRKKKRGEVGSDNDWIGESSDEEVLIAKLRNGKQPNYSTRSKDRKKPCMNSLSNNSKHQKTISADEEDEETLGGFIVNDDDPEEGQDDDIDEEEEEEFDGDDDDDHDDVENDEEDTEE